MILALDMGEIWQNTIFHHPSVYPDEVYNYPVRESNDMALGLMQQ